MSRHLILSYQFSFGRTLVVFCILTQQNSFRFAQFAVVDPVEKAKVGSMELAIWVLFPLWEQKNIAKDLLGNGLSINHIPISAIWTSKAASGPLPELPLDKERPVYP